MKEYKKMDYLFSGLDANTVERESMIEKPFRVDDVFVEAQILCTLNDGMKIELCLWSTEGMSFWDVSINKKDFAASGNTDFLKYLSDKGLPLENVEDKFGKWYYGTGVVEDPDFYRVQYYDATEDKAFW